MDMITITNNKITASFKKLGAELISLIDKDGKEFMWHGDPNHWGKHSPILFPIVGTLKNNTFKYEGVNYSLPRHGFAREMIFAIIEQNDDSIIFSLKSNDATQQKYPFSFELQLSYQLIDATLVLGYKVINNSAVELPFSIGGHPAFSLPKSFENYSLKFDSSNTLTYHLLDDGLISTATQSMQLSNNELALKYSLFENDALVFKKIPSKSVTVLDGSLPILKVSYDNFPDLGIWTPVNAPFICIEPWFGYSDTPYNSGNILEKEGIQLVKPKSFFETSYSISLL